LASPPAAFDLAAVLVVFAAAFLAGAFAAVLAFASVPAAEEAVLAVAAFLAVAFFAAAGLAAEAVDLADAEALEAEDATAAPVAAAATAPPAITLDAVVLDAAAVDADVCACGLHSNHDSNAPPIIKISKPTNTLEMKIQSSLNQSIKATTAPTTAAMIQHHDVQVLFLVKFSMSCPSPVQKLFLVFYCF
jgi:hypothetical protein